MSRLTELIVKAATLLGANEAKMRWRFRRFAIARERSQRAAEVRADRIHYAHKKCASCRAINDRSETTCTNCGQPLRWRITEILARIGAGGVATTSAFLALIFVAVFVASLLSETTHVEPDAGWGFLAGPYLHSDALAVAALCVAVFLLGTEIEDLYGRFTMLALFAATASVGIAARLALLDSLAIGAQTGVSGLIGVGIAAGHFRGDICGRELRNQFAKWAIALFALLLLLLGNIVAEAAAFLVGGLVGAAVSPTATRGRPLGLVLGLIGVALVGTGAVLAVIERLGPLP